MKAEMWLLLSALVALGVLVFFIWKPYDTGEPRNDSVPGRLSELLQRATMMFIALFILTALFFAFVPSHWIIPGVLGLAALAVGIPTAILSTAVPNGSQNGGNHD